MSANTFNLSGPNSEPLGGQSYGEGFAIAWQHGPMSVDMQRRAVVQNGALVDDVLVACMQRIQFQASAMAQPERAQQALELIAQALGALAVAQQPSAPAESATPPSEAQTEPAPKARRGRPKKR